MHLPQLIQNPGSKAEVNMCPASVCSRELFLNEFVLETYSKKAVTQVASIRVGFVTN